MGCGPSRVSLARLKVQRKNNHNNNNNNRHGHNAGHERHNSTRRASESDPNGRSSSLGKRSPNEFYVQRNSHLTEDIGIAKKRIANKIRPISGPLQPPMHRSSSQVDFFRMLDEKIAEGKDYNPEDEEDIRSHRHASSKGHRKRSGSRTSPARGASRAGSSKTLADS